MTFKVLENVSTGHSRGTTQRRIPVANTPSPVPLCRSESPLSTICNTHQYFTVGGNYRPIIANKTAVPSYDSDDDTNLDREDTRRTKRGTE